MDMKAEADKKEGVHGKRVLIVEDDMNLGETLVLALEHYGHKTCFVQGGDDALRCVREEVFDVVFLDLKMPGFSGGFGIYRNIQAARPGTKIIIMTGCSEEEIQKPLADIHAEEVLYKPFSLDDLIAKVDAIHPSR